MPHQINHPLVQDKLTTLRDKHTPSTIFRQTVAQVTMLIAYEALKEISTKPVQIETPIEVTTGQKVSEDVIIVPILRAGAGMLTGLLSLVPQAHVGFVGLERNEETHEPRAYYEKLPNLPEAITFIIDPMLATGGSAIAAIDLLKSKGFQKIILISIIACPEGVQAVEDSHPDVAIYTGSIDSHLNENKYIVPGLGDAGDRIFGT
jgi:uracil phosphoribosyltransferase